MKPSGIVTLLTDFGLDDPFVGVMKGVLLARCPGVQIVDLTHGIEPQDVAQGAFWLKSSYHWFPEGTVHVAVVDPGVGSSRGELVAEANGHWFVAPDNGLLGPILERARSYEVRRIDRRVLGVEKVSKTFHGRDVFAPAAAEIASGRRWLVELGPAVEPSAPSALPRPVEGEREIEGRIVTIDRFGNLISNIRAKHCAAFTSPSVVIGDWTLPLLDTYSDVPPGELLALINAFDVVEVACREGSARDRLGLTKGTPIKVVDLG